MGLTDEVIQHYTFSPNIKMNHCQQPGPVQQHVSFFSTFPTVFEQSWDIWLELEKCVSIPTFFFLFQTREHVRCWWNTVQMCGKTFYIWLISCYRMKERLSNTRDTMDVREHTANHLETQFSVLEKNLLNMQLRLSKLNQQWPVTTLSELLFYE